jgi:hypothetical protein
MRLIVRVDGWGPATAARFSLDGSTLGDGMVLVE